jgi:hypothetical protein
MKYIKIFINFFSDLYKSSKSPFKISEKSYQLMRYFFLISDGLFIHFFSKFLIKGKIKKSKDFKKGYVHFNTIDSQVEQSLFNEICNMRLSNKEIKYEYLKKDKNFKLNKRIDFLYYKNLNLMRLDILSEDLLKNSSIVQFATNKKFLEIINNILGSEPYLLGIDAWITLPPPKAIDNYDDVKSLVSSQMWHRDCDNLRDIKVMTYLTDVDNENQGPFEIVLDTHKFNFFNPFRYQYGSGMRVGNDYIQKKYKENIHTFLGKSGSTFIVDTRGFHRGKTIRENGYYRVILQLLFSNHIFGLPRKNLKLEKSWKSYNLWKNALSSNYKNYSTIFF